MRNLFKNLADTHNSLKNELFKKIKYQIMWGLRSIENEIDIEKGSIIITKEFKIKTNDFTEELSDKIKYLFSVINFK